MAHVRIVLALVLALTTCPVARAFPEAPPPRLDAFGDPLPPGAIARIGSARIGGRVAIGALYSADGKLLVTSDENRFLYLWDADGKAVQHFQVPYGHPKPLALSPDAKLLALNSYGQSFSLWDVATGKELWRLGKNVSVASAVFLADGKSLAVAGYRTAAGARQDDELTFRETVNGKEIRRLEGGGAPVRLSPDGKLLASRSDRHGVALWDAATGKRL